MIKAGQAGVPIALVGKFGGDEVRLGSSALPLATLSELYRHGFEAAVG